MANIKGCMSSKSNEWATPKALFAELDAEFHFTLDPCATAENAKCKKFYTQKEDGLAQDWMGERVFCNPPYRIAIKHWVKKCAEEAQKPGTLVVMLIPARTDTQYFHQHIYHKAEIRFLPGRLHFNDGSGGAPFPSMVVIFRNENAVD